MRRERIDNRWQPWRWSLADVVPHEPAFGTEPRRLRQDEREELLAVPRLSPWSCFATMPRAIT
jgi:hypothetical protein